MTTSRTAPSRSVRRTVIAAVWCAAGFGGSASAEDPGRDPSLARYLPRIPPMEPEQAVRSFQIEEGFRIELVASEPRLADPIDIAFDEDGRMYVAEMIDYPDPPPEDGPPSGRIRVLEDRDRDGSYESSEVFAETVRWPGGIAPWKGGIFVSAPPEILYLKDLDGDLRADLRKVVLTGFGTQAAENMLNNLEWGPDGKIYGTTSYNGGEVRPAESDDSEGITLRNRDFRFDPVTFEVEPLSDTGDFGNTFDDWGNRFICNAGTWIVHSVLQETDLARNPYLTGARTTRSLARGKEASEVYSISPPDPWKVLRARFWEKWVDTTHDMRASRFPDRELAPRGFITSAAGVTLYRGSVFPDGYHGNAFTGEPAGNIVRRMVLAQDGVTFEARLGREGREFLASQDNWFRPVNFANGPDGCLYVVDMYREVIEDSSAIPDDIRRYLDMKSGIDRGRVYRIVPEGVALPPIEPLGAASTLDLVAALEHPDSWRRETAQRLLLERADPEAASSLKRILTRSPSARARVLALQALGRSGDLADQDLLVALKDPDPRVRETAVRSIREGSGSK